MMICGPDWCWYLVRTCNKNGNFRKSKERKTTRSSVLISTLLLMLAACTYQWAYSPT
ncbi:hypothetical protein BDV28DRAFT_137592 [Aspergillus coremiiformis]|uniref:Uncharacterized protein n=1 Tax=Aspergillus coremiiformis TaxID=138285 RepID=A0A5N6Z2P2_9EURO|nr:hypothetical protein BDV28DRAFT_137592 [Aspergillus coremiiformis]